MKKASKKLTVFVLAMMLLAIAVMPLTSAASASTACRTKYPILLVHGAGFSDDNLGISYWGDIPETLEAQGAKVYYGGTDGWGGIENNAKIIKDRVNAILKETGAKKVNIIAHSKGGIETRYMISSLGMGSKVASLTMIATPNHGSKTFDELFDYSGFVFKFAGLFVNGTRKLAGDKDPDFVNGWNSFSVSYMNAFNQKNKNDPGVYYQSYAATQKSILSHPVLGITYAIVKNYEGENDGLVSVESAKWGNFRGVLRGTGIRGISHMDEVNVLTGNLKIEKMDNGATTILDFYVNMLKDLKTRGY